MMKMTVMMKVREMLLLMMGTWQLKHGMPSKVSPQDSWGKFGSVHKVLTRALIKSGYR